uniref:Myotubularin phosphatase domain-containing protein n=1 Tax=Macrostomum lignano TaxID=282301 RepID=A0A1I8JNR5_9PLAT
CVSYAHLLQPSALRRRYLDGQLSVSSRGSDSGSGSGISVGLTPYKRFVSADEYSQLAAVSGQANGSAVLASVSESAPLVAYHPHLLDNPELVCGKHRTVLNFSSFRPAWTPGRVAQAYVFFEKLALKELESAFRLSRREILPRNGGPCSAWSFSLAVPDYEVLSHQQRILNSSVLSQREMMDALPI